MGGLPTDREVIATIGMFGFAATTDIVWKELCKVLDRFGFDRLNYGLTPALHDSDRVSLSPRFVLTSHRNPRVRQMYSTPRIDRSPLRIWGMRNVGALSWSHQRALAAEYGLADEMDIVEHLLESLGIIAGYTIGFPVLGQTGKAALGLTARPGTTQAEVDALWRDHGPAIEALATAAHGRLSQLPMPSLPPGLKARHLEVLGWVADGKSIQDIAVLTDLSVSAVEKHLARAREVLNAQTTAQAVAQLALLNQLHLPTVTEEPSQPAR